MPSSKSGSNSNSSRSKSNQSRQRKEKKRRRRSSSSGSSKHHASRRYGNSDYKRQNQQLPASKKLFITNIESKYAPQELKQELEETFGVFGKIKQTTIKTKHGSNNSFVFIQFEEMEGAIKAQEEMKGKEFKGKELKVEFGKGERKFQDRKSDKCYLCHRSGHFAKDCKYNRFTTERGSGRGGDRRDYRRRSHSRSDSDRSYRRKKHDSRRRDRYSRSRSPQRRSYHHSSRDSYRRN